MTKEKRLEQFEQFLEQNVRNEDARAAARNIFSQGYDQGFADGVVRGQNYQAQVTEMITGAMVGR